MTEEANTDEGSGQDGKGDRMVPLAALTAETTKRQSLQTEVAELRGRVDGMASVVQPAAKQEPKLWTRAALRSAVEDEKITQDEADALMDKQTEDRLSARFDAKLEAGLNTQNLGAKVETQIGRYKTAVKDLGDKDSANFQKVAGAFKRLVGNGHNEKALLTELTALEVAFGDIDTLTDTSNPGTRKTFQETGGRDGGGEDSGGDTDGYPKGTTAAQRRYYGDLINKGVYTKESAVEELKYKPANRPARGKAA